MTQTAYDAEHATHPEPTPIESATASTACQTNASKFAYLFTAGVLAVAYAVLAAGIVFASAIFSGRLESAASSGLTDGYSYDYGYGYGDEYGYGDNLDGTSDLLGDGLSDSYTS